MTLKTNKNLIYMIKLCLDIDRMTSHVYLNFANNSNNEQLKQFWLEMHSEEQCHCSYWESLIISIEKSDIPCFHPLPDNFKKELEELRGQSSKIVEKSITTLDIKTSFTLAYRLEFFLLHPAFDTLFYFSEIELKNEIPDNSYKDHIQRFISATNTFGLDDILIQLTAEMIEGIWSNNRLISKQFHDIKTLYGVIPICAGCKKIRDDEGFWKTIEKYVSDNSYAEFTHSICPKCVETLYPDIVLPQR